MRPTPPALWARAAGTAGAPVAGVRVAAPAAAAPPTCGVAPFGSTNRILVGGGGGGAGSYVSDESHGGAPGAGGHGSGRTGGAGGAGTGGLGSSDVPYQSVGASGGGGGGGGASAPGAGGAPSAGTKYDGCSFWDPAKPLGGSTGSGANGGAGGYLVSFWSGLRCDQSASWGGGGGGGWYGGGGGASGVNGGGGGGGGSGYAATGYVGSRLGEPGAHGVITISYVRPTDGWASQGGDTMTSAPTVAVRPWNGSRLTSYHDVFYLNNASAVIQRTYFEGVPRPEFNLGATLHPGSTVAAVWRYGFPDRLDLFGRGTEGALWQKSFDGTSWGPWLARTGPGVVASDPTAVSLSSGRLDVMFRGPDSKLLQLTSTDGRWSAAPTPVPGHSISTGPGATYTGPGRVDLLAGCGNALCWWTYDGSSWTYYGAVGAGGVSSTPTVISPARGVVEVAVRDENNNLSRLRYTETTDWGAVTTVPISSPPGQSVALATGGSGASVAYARGPDNRLSAKAPW